MNRNKVLFMLVVISFMVGNFSIKEYQKYLSLNDGLMHVYFLNIGQGDSFLIKTPSNKLILVDGGPDEALLFRLNKLLPFWINQIDLVIISHFHRDHYMGIFYLIHNFEVKEILYPDLYKPTEEVLQLFDGFVAGTKTTNEYLYLKSNLSYMFDSDFKISILKSPDYIRPINENHESSIVLVGYKNVEVLFTGDAPPSVQKAAQSFLPANKIEVLKVPHQGSKYDLNQSFIEYINPKSAILSVGKNSYGHPHKEVLDYYRKVLIPLYRTDQARDFILFKSDGNTYNFFYY